MRRCREAGVALVLAIAASASAETLPVPAVYPTIRSALLAAAPGDTVSVDCGTYPEDLLEIPSGVVLRSVSGDPSCATIDAGEGGTVLYGSNLDASTRIEGLTITGGDASNHGGGGYFADSDVHVSHCVFFDNETANWGGGLAFQGVSSPVIEDCRFLKNRSLYGGGIYCEGGSVVVRQCFFHRNEARISGGALTAWSGASRVLVEDCVLAENDARHVRGGAVLVSGAEVSLVGCTLARNRADDRGAAVYSSVGGRTWLKRCIVAFHTGAKVLVCDRSASIEVSCSDVYGNWGGDTVACDAAWDSGDNFFEDPRFCDADVASYALHVDSPCLPAAAGACGLVGALGVGCAALPVETLGWGVIKARYR